MRPFVEEWHREHLATIGTKSLDATWVDFCNAWEDVRCPEGEGLLDVTFRSIDLSTPVPDKLKSLGYGAELFAVVELCRRLARADDAQFFLGCRSLADLLGWSAPTANNALRMLVRHGILEKISNGAFATPKGPQSSEYRFKGW